MADPRTDFFATAATPASDQDARTAFFTSPESATAGQLPKEEGILPWKEVAGRAMMHAATGIGASAVAGARSIYDLATGVPLSEIDKRNQKFISEHTYTPSDRTSQAATQATDNPASPLNWPGKAFDTLGDAINQVTDPRTWEVYNEASRRSAAARGEPYYGPPAALPTTGTGSTALGPVISGIAQVALGAKPIVDAARASLADVGPEIPTSRTAPGWGKEPEVAAAKPVSESAPALSATSGARQAPFEPRDIPERPGTPIDTEPVEGGLPATASNERAAVLKRVGLENARESAIKGDAKAAATDWQLSKFDEPAGIEAKAQFDSERNALMAHSQKLIADTGGTLGTDEDALHARGQTVARPFDALSDWFDQQRRKLYAAADQRAQGGPITNLESVDALLKDPQFRNTLLAKDQGNLLSSIENQLGEFRKQSPQGFNVQGTEQFRQWLNQIWTNDNKNAIGAVKNAIDNDVLKGAGEDIYGPARALVQMKAQTLDNPNGISRLMEHDPQTPINRVTSYEKIPDTLARLPVAQFDQVLKTLDVMPEELQPLAQQAKAEIKAHLLNKVNDAGNSTSGQWNARGVEKVIRANSAKLQSAFADQPEVLRNLQDLRSAGNILSVNQSYPGAAAQASNALKRGLMSRALSHVAGSAGAAAGGVLGPLGAAGGAAAGEALGAKAGAAASEKAALKNWRKGVRNLAE
jgi:hypothetical protein